MAVPLVGIYNAARLGIELGGTAAKVVLKGFEVYQLFDNKGGIADATERATRIIEKLNSFTAAHNSALCEWSYDVFAREMFPAAIQTYFDAYIALQECVDDGWEYGRPIGFIPSFYRQRILDKNLYMFTKQEWNAARSQVIPCAWKPTEPEQNPTKEKIFSIGEKLVVGLVIAFVTVYITRKYNK